MGEFESSFASRFGEDIINEVAVNYLEVSVESLEVEVALTLADLIKEEEDNERLFKLIKKCGQVDMAAIAMSLKKTYDDN